MNVPLMFAKCEKRLHLAGYKSQGGSFFQPSHTIRALIEGGAYSGNKRLHM